MQKTEQATILAAICNLFNSLTLSDIGVLVSILVTLLTLFLNWSYKAKEHKLKERELELKLKQYKEKF
ncbi:MULTISPECIES: HP1 family phage holin [Mannheimia]|uniref:HP1 family phage holin n=1 Tax=Mannheimia TaxID=75984 RepID=UPI00159F430A|nr:MULTISPECIES: HP1 family phage holin [Mannheimia]QLB44719.1 holin [Mannheimia pernigra]QTM01890.1 holin [Mannheimia sp. ZY171111]